MMTTEDEGDRNQRTPPVERTFRLIIRKIIKEIISDKALQILLAVLVVDVATGGGLDSLEILTELLQNDVVSLQEMGNSCPDVATHCGGGSGDGSGPIDIPALR